MLIRETVCQAGAMSKQWRVDRRMTILKAAGAAAFLLGILLFGQDPAQLAIGLVVAVAIAGFAVRDVVAPVRLAADPTGLTVVTGFATRRHLDWADIERVHVDNRGRMGRRVAFLEVDAGDNLYLFSKNELSADLDDVAAEIAHLRTGR
jgi:hypothetical protein